MRTRRHQARGFGRRALPLAAACASATCVPNLGPGDSLLTSPRILAVRAVPAEAVPGTSTVFTAFVAGLGGAVATAPIDWDFCIAPLPLTEDNVVANACLGSSSLVPAGAGLTSTTATPKNGCTLFGPDTPPGTGLRPTDPDPTGGYYQPIRAVLSGAETVFDLVRIRCNLAQADAATATAFAAAYTPNKNPTLLPIAAAIESTPTTLNAIPAGAQVNLTASWTGADAETFAYFDPGSQTVTTQRESMQVAWYSTAGTLDTESTGRAAADLATTTSDRWTAPATPGPAFVFVVLRDSRGGVDFATVELTVVP